MTVKLYYNEKLKKWTGKTTKRTYPRCEGSAEGCLVGRNHAEGDLSLGVLQNPTII